MPIALIKVPTQRTTENPESKTLNHINANGSGIHAITPWIICEPANGWIPLKPTGFGLARYCEKYSLSREWPASSRLCPSSSHHTCADSTKRKCNSFSYRSRSRSISPPPPLPQSRMLFDSFPAIVLLFSSSINAIAWQKKNTHEKWAGDGDGDGNSP